MRSCIPVPKIENDSYDWYQRHEEKLHAARTGHYKIVFIGDSITHFWSGESGSDHGSAVWREMTAGLPVLNLGYGFDRTQNVLWRLANGELANQSPELVVINIGTNQFSITGNYSGDTPEVAAAGVVQVWQTVHTMFPKAKIVAMALFPRGGKHAEITGTNRILREEAAKLDYVKLVDLTHQLGDAAGEPIPVNYQGDLCHLAVPGYRIWQAAITPELQNFSKQ